MSAPSSPPAPLTAEVASSPHFSDDEDVIVALDIGSSSARASVYAADGQRLEGLFHQERYRATSTADGGSEHDPARLLQAAAACLDRVLGAPGLPPITGVGITTFWHGLLGFDTDGEPITPLFTWADTRAAADATALRATLEEDAVHARTGCHLHPCYWPAKLRWLRRTQPAHAARVARWGSIGEHLERTFFGAAATSVSMASGTGLFDQRALAWDPDALVAAGIDEDRLFPLCDRERGRQGLRRPWARRWPALADVPWFPAVGDGAASNVGSDCVDPSRIALNVGTSAALRLVAEAALAPPPPRGLWSYRIDGRRLLLGGATSEGGNVYAWLRGVLHLPDDEALEAELAGREPAAHGLTALPFLAGERSPGWRSERRAAIAGLSLATSAVDIVQAGLEAVALRLAIVYDLLAPLAAPGHAIVASGGALVHSRAWAQIIADALGQPLVLSPEDEATSRGSALLALDALGHPVGPSSALSGETIEPTPHRHARLREALEGQRRLDSRV